MLYIHELRHLTPKMADLESISLVRELKQKMPLPLSVQKVTDYCAEFFMSPTDEEVVQQTIATLWETIPVVNQLSQEQNPQYEQINVERALRILQETEQPLLQNLQYIQEMVQWQQFSLESNIPILNGIPRLRSAEQKAATNDHLKKMFAKLLRNEEFFFRHNDVINEAHMNHVAGLSEGMEKGFLMHITLEEELKKLTYAIIKQRLPEEEQQRLEMLKEKISALKQGVDRAYQANMRMVKYAAVMYAYVKWLSSEM